jgi:hypothetical protein
LVQNSITCNGNLINYFPKMCVIYNYFSITLTGQKYFRTKIFPYIFHIFMKFSPLIVELLEFIWISSCNFFELLFTSIYDLNTNVNSWRHNFIWLYSKIWWKKLNLFLNQFLRESRNKIILKLYEEETIFISSFNAENFMKIR